MTRVVKKADVRRDEILDVAGRLFVAKGYDATTINDILDEVGIARGTLYHHFRSKEQVLDGLIHRHGDRLLARLNDVASSDLPVVPKLLACVAVLSPGDAGDAALIDELGKAPDAALFLKSLDDIQLRLAPAIAQVVEQGVAAGVFHTPYPLEAVRIILAATHSLLDNQLLALTPEERAVQQAALVDAAERILGAESGSFSLLAEVGMPS